MTLNGNSAEKIGAATTDTQEAVARIWGEILQQPDVTGDSDFFELGGDSMMSMMVLFRVKDELNVELPAGTLSEKPKFRQFCDLIEASRAT